MRQKLMLQKLMLQLQLLEVAEMLPKLTVINLQTLFLSSQYVQLVIPLCLPIAPAPAAKADAPGKQQLMS